MTSKSYEISVCKRNMLSFFLSQKKKATASTKTWDLIQNIPIQFLLGKARLLKVSEIGSIFLAKIKYLRGGQHNFINFSVSGKTFLTKEHRVWL